MSVTPPGSRRSSPRCGAGAQRRPPHRHDVVERHAELDRDGRRREHVGQVAHAEQRRVADRRAPTGVRHPRRACPSSPSVVTDARPDVGRRVDAEGHDPAGERAAPGGMIRASSALATRHVGAGRRPRGSPPWRRRSRRPTRRSRGARRRRWSTPARPVRRCRPACGSRRRGSCRARPPRPPAPARSSSSESGRPMWLFRLPLFRIRPDSRASRNAGGRLPWSSSCRRCR